MEQERWGDGPLLDWRKIGWFGSHGLVALAFGVASFEWTALLVCAGLAFVTGCIGHSVGVHRLLIHQSFRAPRWLERLLVYLGTLMGMAGPLELVVMHYQRDRLQQCAWCPDFFAHRGGMLKDFFSNFFCRYPVPANVLPPPNSDALDDRFYRALDATWRWQQIPLGIVLFSAGGWGWLVWGVSVRVFVSTFVHWYVGYRCHNDGDEPREVPGAGVQGKNHFWLGILSFGEGFHNNHHAFPDSAKMGLAPGEFDLGWWVVSGLQALGWATDIKLAGSDARCKAVSKHEFIEEVPTWLRQDR